MNDLDDFKGAIASLLQLHPALLANPAYRYDSVDAGTSYRIKCALDAIRMTTNHPVSTPANWNPGDDIVIGGSVSNEQAAKQFPGFKTVKPYLRTAAAPK